MAVLADIRVALAAALQPALDAVGGGQPSAYTLESPTPPTLWVMGPDQIVYDMTMRRSGFDQWTMIVQGFVGSPLDKAAQVNLDLWLAPSGATSVKAAIEADRTLGGIVDDLTVTEASGYRRYQFQTNGPTVLGCDWSVLINNPAS